MKLKQLERLRNTPRKLNLPSGKEVSYDITVLEKCLELAPEAVMLDLADSLVSLMWNAYESSSEDNVSTLVSAINAAETNNRGLQDRLDFCQLFKEDATKLKGLYKDSLDFGIDLTQNRLLFTTDMKEFTEYSSNVIFKEDDFYFVYDTSEDGIKVLAYKQVSKDGCIYFRGFNDEIIYQNLQSVTVMKKYLGPLYKRMTLGQLREVLSRRVEWQKVVKETLGNKCNIGGVDVVLEPCLVEPETGYLSVKGLTTSKVFDITNQAIFTHDQSKMIPYRNHDYPLDIVKGYYYLYKVEKGICFFISKDIVERDTVSVGHTTHVSGFEYEEDLCDSLRIPMDSLKL